MHQNDALPRATSRATCVQLFRVGVLDAGGPPMANTRFFLDQRKTKDGQAVLKLVIAHKKKTALISCNGGVIGV